MRAANIVPRTGLPRHCHVHQVPCKGVCPQLRRVQKPCTADVPEFPRRGKHCALHPTSKSKGSVLSGKIRGPQVGDDRGHAMEVGRSALIPFPNPGPPGLARGNRSPGGHEATDTGLAYAPVSQAHGHNPVRSPGGETPLSKRATGAGGPNLLRGQLLLVV